ncbi:hypothetical protein ACWCXH_10460 [Kitasatospora sp. NPDC001660]
MFIDALARRHAGAHRRALAGELIAACAERPVRSCCAEMNHLLACASRDHGLADVQGRAERLGPIEERRFERIEDLVGPRRAVNAVHRALAEDDLSRPIRGVNQPSSPVIHRIIRSGFTELQGLHTEITG